MLCFTRHFLQRQQKRLEASAIRYVASDMDGTILGADHALSEFTKQVLFEVTQTRKIPFIFATGRLHADVAVVNDHLQEFFRVARAKKHMEADSNFTATPVYLITSNGAVAHNARTKETVMEECIPEHLVRELYALLPASETRINTNLCQRDKWYCRMDWAEMLQFHKESGLTYQILDHIPAPAEADNKRKQRMQQQSQETPLPSPLEAVKMVGRAKHGKAATDVKGTEAVDFEAREPSDGDISSVTKMFFSSWDKMLLDKLETLLQERYAEQLSINYSASYCIDITKKGATKANALRTVLSLLSPPIRTSPHEPLTAEQEAAVADRMAHTISFGNDLNDASMLQSTGQGFLMGNSNSRLIEQCEGMEVVGTHDKHGVAAKLCEILDIKVNAKRAAGEYKKGR